MSYDKNESGHEIGSPIELYDIALGGESWHFTSGEDAVTMDMVDYIPFPVGRENLPLSQDDRTNQVPISLPGTHEFVQRYQNLVPAQKATLTIRRFHRYDDDSEVISFFKGTVAGVTFNSNGSIAQVGVMPNTDGLVLQMPRYNYSSLCNHVLYDRWCTIDPEGTSPDSLPYTFTGVVSAISSNQITITGIAGASYPDEFFQAGDITTAAGDRRLVVRQEGDDLRLYIPLFEGLALIGQTVTVRAGCDHSLITCVNKFNNIINYGGFPYVPLNNPFEVGLA